MKKIKSVKLTANRETVRILCGEQLRPAAGGNEEAEAPPTSVWCTKHGGACGHTHTPLCIEE